MRLFQQLKQRRFRRRYIAALTIYLSAYTYKQLSAADQKRVLEWIRNLIDGRFTTAFSFKEFELFLPIRVKAAFWAVAMKALSIPPAIPGETWQIPAQPRRLNRFRVANKVLRDWRLSSNATTEAEEYLKSKGVDVTTMDLTAR